MVTLVAFVIKYVLYNDVEKMNLWDTKIEKDIFISSLSF
jgi:hypothetical protein